jgi:tRNA 2-thiocytidine biosynthesis protein TtcA
MRETPAGRGGFRFRSKLERRIVRRAGAAVGDHGLVQEGDHIMAAVSGGKDSLALLEVLHLLRRRSPVPFSITAVTIDQDLKPGAHLERLERHYREHGYDHHFERVPIEEVVREKLEQGTIPCSLCSRLRRGVLYSMAQRLGCTKIALGHHLDDLIETLLMNLFFSGQLRTMPPLLTSDDERNVVIRPLCYVPESWLREYGDQRGFRPVTCGSCAGPDSQREQIKELVERLSQKHPQLRYQMLRAMKNVKPEYLLDCRLVQGRGIERAEEE